MNKNKISPDDDDDDDDDVYRPTPFRLLYCINFTISGLIALQVPAVPISLVRSELIQNKKSDEHSGVDDKNEYEDTSRGVAFKYNLPVSIVCARIKVNSAILIRLHGTFIGS